MLIVRPVQMDRLAESVARQVDRWLADHARRWFGARCALLGDDGLAALIARCRAEAQRAGLSSPRALCCWLDLAFFFGPDFAQPGALPWLAPLLDETRGQDEAVRVDRLTAAARAWLERAPLAPAPPPEPAPPD
jgi:hypothetical protein